MLLYGLTNAQTFAVYIDAPSVKEPVNQKSYNEIVGAIKNKLKLNAWFYKHKDKVLTLDTTFRKGDEEVAADLLLSIYFKIYEDTEQELKFSKDTTGKVIGAYYTIYPLTQYRFVLTDLSTSEILYYKGKYSRSLSEREGKRFDVNMESYFGAAGPVALSAKSPKDYKAALNKIKKDYQPKFLEYYTQMSSGFQSMVSSAAKPRSDEKPYKIESPVVTNGKLKEFKADSVTGFYTDMYVTVFSLDTIGTYIIPQNYKYWQIERIDGVKCNMDTYFPLPSKNKEAGEAIENGRQLYFLPGDHPYAENLDKGESIMIDVQGVDLSKAGEIYNFLFKSQRVRLINSLEKSLITDFHERFKGDRFIESGYSLSTLGARYIFTTSDIQYSIQDAQTGTVLGVCPLNYGDKGVFDLFQKALDLKVIIIKPTDTKKESIKEALVYSPLGFYEDFYFDIMLRTPENVGGKILHREVEIGKGQVLNESKYGNLFAEAKFTKGEKEIGAAYFNQQEILFLNREFKFLTMTYK